MTENKKTNPAYLHRDSNLELLRCIAMILIIACHYMGNSGLISVNGPVWENECSFKSVFIFTLGPWGSTGINCFVLITGYYMCKSNITARKYFRLLAEVYFYKIIITCLFILSGYQPITRKILIQTILPFSEINLNFTGCFLVFYLFIPFLSILVRTISVRQHTYLICLCLFIYTIFKSLPGMKVPMHYVSWFIVIFLISSFLRLHMKKYMEKENSIKEWGGLIFLLFIDLLLIVVIAYLSHKYKYFSRNEHVFINGTSKLLPLITSIYSFIVFKKMKLRYIPIINIMGGATFGVLLIHANSDTMRRWLWHDVLHNVEMFNSPTSCLVFHAIGSILIIFIICVVIDRLRIRFIEPPMMACFDKLWPSVVRHYSCFENWFAKKTHCLLGE